MPKCKLCAKKGIFLKLNADGICQNCEHNIIETQHKTITLWWLNTKKFTTKSKSMPKKFTEAYNLHFDKVFNELLSDNMIEKIGDNYIVTASGKSYLQKNYFYITLHLHPYYNLTVLDFINSPLKPNDTAWAAFNKRQLEYTKNNKWSSLYRNYINMATLLIEEKRYKNALNELYPAIFIATSGLLDDNILCPYELVNGYLKVSSIEINNYDISNNIRIILDNLKLNLDDIKDDFTHSIFINSLKSILPFYYLDTEESWTLLYQAIQSNEQKGIFNLYGLQQLGIKIKFNTPNSNSNIYFYNSLENILRNKK